MIDVSVIIAPPTASMPEIAVVHGVMHDVDCDAVRTLIRAEHYKLLEVSVSLGIIHYLALKGVAEGTHKSLSRVIREAVEILLEKEVWAEYGTYKHLLQELGVYPPKSSRDIEELEALPDLELLSDEKLDRMFDEVDDLTDDRCRKGLFELTCTINVSLSAPAIGAIAVLTALKLYVTQSEFLRRAISDHLNTCLWPSSNPSACGFFEKH